jgi:hypothetical protein
MARWRELRGGQHVVFVWRPDRADRAFDEWSAGGIETSGAPPFVGRTGEEALRRLVVAAEEEAKR